MAQKKTNNVKVFLKTGVVMAKEVVTIDENASVKEAADIMNQAEISCIIATKKGKAAGIITERDLLKRIISEGKNAKRTRVKGIMSTPLITITSDTDVEEAARLMFEKKMKKLAVIDHNRLVGGSQLNRHCPRSAEHNKGLAETRCFTRAAEKHQKSFRQLHRLMKAPSAA